MLSYKEAVKILDSKESKKICNNTILSRISKDTVKIALHGHGVIYITHNSSDKGDIYALYDCGHKTMTTKRKLNKYGPKTVYQKDFVWYTNKGEFKNGQMFFANGEKV